MAGVESTGFVRKLHAECVSDIVTEARGTIDSEYDDSPDSATGQLAIIVGAKHAELWEVLEAVYNSLGPSASGYSLDRVGALSDSRRKAPTATLLQVTLTGTDGSYAPDAIDLTVDGTDYHFTNRSTLAISGGTGTGVFACTTEGPVRVPVGTLGPNVTSFALVSLGALDERDPAFRVRRRNELADEGTSTVPALRAALSKLDNVVTPRVYSNRKSVADSAGRPPKSIECVVLVNDTSPEAIQPIADTIWANLPAGIETHGTTTVEVIDEEGHSQDVKLSLATPTNLYAFVSLYMDAAAYPGNDAVREAVAGFTSGALTITSNDGTVIDGLVPLGGEVSRSKVSTAALTVPGVRTVESVYFALAGDGPYVFTDYALAPRAYLGVGAARGFQVDRVIVQAIPKDSA